VDVLDRGDEFIVTVDLPGARTQDIDLRVERDRLQIEVTAREEPGGEAIRRERRQTPLRRTIQLPAWVDERHTSATYRDGVLRVRLRKRDGPRSIEVE